MNDEIIKRSIAAKDENAIRMVMDKYSRLLWKVSWGVLDRIGCTQDVEECVADAFIYLWEHPDKFDPGRGGLKNWLCIVARTRALDRCREITRQNVGSLENTLLSTSGPEDLLSRVEARRVIHTALLAMEEPSREILTRRYCYGQRPGRIAAAMGLSVKQVDNYLYRAKQKLRLAVGGYYESIS